MKTNSQKRSTGACWMAATLLMLPAILPAQQIAIGQYPVPTRGSQAVSITGGPDGNLWFTSLPDTTINQGGIGRMTPAGVFKEFNLPAYPGNETGGIVSGPDGALWFTEYGTGEIGRITTSGKITNFPVPTSGSSPDGITLGPDGALWFTEYTANQIGRITTGGHVTEYAIPTANSGAGQIVTGPDGALWFSEFNANQIGRITKGGHVTEYPVPTAGSQPNGIAAGPDDALWFTEFNGNNVGRISTAGSVTEYPIPTPVCEAESIVAGPEGALWFAELNGGKVARITTAGVITEYPVPAPIISLPGGIAFGPEGSLWLTDEGTSNAIDQVVFQTASLSVTPGTATYNAKLKFTGSGFMPGETVDVYTSGVGSAVLASGTADGGGAVTIHATVPAAAYGPRLFLGSGASSGNVGAASFTTESLLVLTPSSGPVGTLVTVQGYGFGSYELVQLTWNNPDTLFGRITVGVSGGFSNFTFTVPAGSPPGTNAVFGTGTLPRAKAVFTVE